MFIISRHHIDTEKEREKQDKLTQVNNNINQKQKKEYNTPKQDALVLLALAGLAILVIGTILSIISLVMQFTADSRVEAQAGQEYGFYGLVMIIVGIILSKIGFGGLPNKPKNESNSSSNSTINTN